MTENAYRLTKAILIAIAVVAGILIALRWSEIHKAAKQIEQSCFPWSNRA